jgi:hypothetical protein
MIEGHNNCVIYLTRTDPDMNTRRRFLRDLGLSTAALPLLSGLPSLRAAEVTKPKQRLILFLSPNGTLPPLFWPDETGENFTLKRILAPLEPFKKHMLTLKGLSNKVRGDGDGHMRGMSCLLTGKELFPGNIQGGSDTPAGWCKGISIDQELKNFLQADPQTKTRFGSLELGVAVPNRADPWTRWTYAGPNQPVAPIDDPYQFFEKIYGSMKDRENLASVLDELDEDLRKISSAVSAEDRDLLDKHLTFVREMERELNGPQEQPLTTPQVKLEPGVSNDNDSIPRLMQMQMDLLANAFANDMARIATVQFTNSVGQSRMKWLGIDEGHHSLSHEPDNKEDAQEKLAKINVWLCEQLAALATKLANTPEPGGSGSMLDHTTILWTNELGKGNSHTHDDIPFMLCGGGLGFKTGRALQFDRAAHNRLWLSIAQAFGHNIQTFGNPDLCGGGALGLT